MGPVAENIKSFFESFSSEKITSIEKLPKSGGDRIYFRIYTDQNSFIATYNENVRESETFLYFTEHFSKINAPVPHVYFTSEDGKIYIQQDFGPVSLLNELECDSICSFY